MSEYPSYEGLSIEELRGKLEIVIKDFTVVTANLSAQQIEIRLIVDDLTNRISKK